jgi:hypothetical protein
VNETVTGYCATPELADATFDTAVTVPVAVAPVAERLDELELLAPPRPRRPRKPPKPPKPLELAAVVTVRVACCPTATLAISVLETGRLAV